MKRHTTPAAPRKASFLLQETEPVDINMEEIAREIAPPTDDKAAERRPYGPDSAYHIYLQEIGQTKLLTPQEDVTLARRI